MKEIWKDIKNYEGYYQVSNLGRIKSLKRTTFDTVRKYVKTTKETILKDCVTSPGYATINLSKNRKRTNKKNT